ncbi:MAG: RsfS/YbeB/iojap family protein, partial [Burkholderiales bacterium]
MNLDEQVKTAVFALEDIKARDIVVLDVSRLTSLFDRMIVASAESTRQTKALSES